MILLINLNALKFKVENRINIAQIWEFLNLTTEEKKKRWIVNIDCCKENRIDTSKLNYVLKKIVQVEYM